MSKNLALRHNDTENSSAKSVKAENNPALLYLNSLQGKTGRVSMRSFLNRIAVILGGHDLETFKWTTLTPTDLETVKNNLIDQDIAPRTIDNYLAALRGTAKHAWMSGQITHEAYLMISLVKRARGRRLPSGRALSVDEIHRLYASINTETLIGKRDLALITLLVECGMRRAEAQTLKISAINWKEAGIVVRTKGNKERMIYLTENAAKYLEKFIQYHPFRADPDAPVFIRIRREDKATKREISAKSVNDILDKWRVQAGVERFTPHDLRRTFATYLFDKNVDSKLIKDAMGHENIATTMRYDRRKEARTAKLMRRFRYEE